MLIKVALSGEAEITNSHCNSPGKCNTPRKTEQYVTKDDSEAIGSI